MPTPLTTQQLKTFESDGVLRLPAFYSAETAARMAARLWEDLTERYGARKEDAATGPSLRPSKFQAVEKAGAFRDMDSPALRDLLDQLVGDGAWDPPKRWGQALVTFPSEGPWDVPSQSWHTDYPATDCAIPLPAVRFFVLLEPVGAKGGATHVIAGSHQAMMALAREGGASVRSSDAKDILELRSPWLRSLLSKTDKDDRVGRFIDTAGDICGHRVRVEALTGNAGDVILMHPGMMHVGTQNVLDRPRMMLVQSIVRRDWRHDITY